MEKTIYPLSIKRIFHPTDFTLDSDIAFAHALGISVKAGARLDLMHVAPAKEKFDSQKFPSINLTLRRWGYYNSFSKASVKPGIKVNKIVEKQSDPAKSILQFLENHSTDLIVLASHGTAAHPIRWLHKSVAEPIARESHVMTLFIPHGDQGFISFDCGKMTL